MAKRRLTEYTREIASKLETLTFDQATFSYDALSDTLYIYLSDRARFGTNVYVGEGWMVRVDRQTDAVLGIQIDNALSHASEQHPILVNLIMLAEPEGYQPSPIESAARRIVATHSADTIAELRELVPELAAAGD